MDTLLWKPGKEAGAITNAETIQIMMKKLCDLINDNISPEGNCLFDPVRVRLALELVEFEIQKSIQENNKAD